MAYLSTNSGVGGIDGTLTSGRVPFASDSDTLTDDGEMTYDATNDLLTVTKTLTQVVVDVHNATGSAIGAGTPVYVTGGVTANKPNVEPSDANNASTMPSAGIVTNQIGAGSSGYMAISGVINGISLSVITDGSPAAGDTLYVSTTTGELTVTKPTGTTSQIQNVGRIISINGGNFRMTVNNIGRTNDVPNEFTVPGDIEAASFTVTGGAGTGFLKGDGTLDSNTYLTSFTETDPVVGAITGIVKANGAGTISAASAGTDYLTPTGDGSGLSGVVTAETDPVVGAITGIVKANGAGTISAATADVDYVFTKYTDAEAIAAVEGEATLDLTGALTSDSTIQSPRLETVSVADGTTLTAATHAGRYLICSGSVTLPATSTTGEHYTILNTTGGDITVGRNANNINGAASDATVGTYNGATAIAIGSNNWIVLGV